MNGTELADSGLDLNGDGAFTGGGWRNSGFDYDRDGVVDASEWTASGYDDGSGGGTANDGILDAGEVAAAIAADATLDTDTNGAIEAGNDLIHAPYYVDGYGNTIAVGNSVNLAGLQQPALDPGNSTVHRSNGGLNYRDMLTDENGDGTDGDGYIKDITQISIEEFTNIIEKIADVRAENGAEQARVSQSSACTRIIWSICKPHMVGLWMWMWRWSPPDWPATV